MADKENLPVSIIGASGYAGAELVRLILGHPRLTLAGLYARRHVGEPIAKQFPQFAGRLDQKYAAYDPAEVARVSKLAFLALPHGESATIAAALLERGVTVLDLSADFRLRSEETYREWYGDHPAPNLLPLATYGLVEQNREALKKARLVAVPGCYPTATLLALGPLCQAGMVATDTIVVDAKSGVSGAGRSPGLTTHFPEAAEGIRSYKTIGHRHTPEIEQELSRLGGKSIGITFTPHLVPMSRGLLATCYASVPSNCTQADLTDCLNKAYGNEPFVTVVDHPPDTTHVRGSNRAHVAAFYDQRQRRVVAMGAIDNLVKGAAGQAIQCANIISNWPETLGLEALGLFP